MKYQFQNSAIDAEFNLLIGDRDIPAYFQREDYLLMLWNNDQEDVKLWVDDRIVELPPEHIIFLTYNQKIKLLKIPNGLIGLIFNRPFYCIHTNDSEVSCNGLLFFGSNYTPILGLDQEEKSRLKTLIGVLEEEFQLKDSNQEEMLRLLLKRFIIRCTRMARSQLANPDATQKEIDLIRQFNALVEKHFKEKRKVSDYAELLFKSPKTISNVFRLYESKSPIQVIHDRVILEAKRYLYYTDKSVKEISAALGFEEPTQFNKFFKKNTGFTPLDFKNKGRKLEFGKN